MSLFLTAEDVAELTGINRGVGKKSREDLQVEWLQRQGIAHRVNARGRPILTLDAAMGNTKKQTNSDGWSPSVLAR